jgi:hypothetical protein
VYHSEGVSALGIWSTTLVLCVYGGIQTVNYEIYINLMSYKVFIYLSKNDWICRMFKNLWILS